MTTRNLGMGIAVALAAIALVAGPATMTAAAYPDPEKKVESIANGDGICIQSPVTVAGEPRAKCFLQWNWV